MNCFCGGKLINIKVNEKIIDSDGDIIFVTDIPALYCVSCKQTFFDAKTSDILDEIQKGKDKKHVITWGDEFGEKEKI